MRKLGMGLIIGIDHGTKHIGVAVSDETELLSTPTTTLSVTKRRSPADLVAKYVENYGQKVDRIVVGIPYGSKGQPTKQGNLIVEFAKDLETKTGIPVILWDETGTSLLAPPTTKKHDLHAQAASLILQGYLDFQRQGY